MAATPNGEISRYPLGLIEKTTDWFKVSAYDYSSGGTPNTGGTNTGSLLDPAVLGSPRGHIILPMPSNIQDGNSVSYGEDKLNSLTARGADIAYGAMDKTDVGQILKGDFTTATDTFNKIGGLLENPALKTIVLKSLAAEAVNVFGGNVSIDSLLARETGQVLNPNMELLFNGVTLRTFRFSFKMIPREPKESANIKKIIKFLKQKMAARGSGTFLDTPHIFDLSYRKGGEKHPFLYSFKPCFLKDMSVNYTGENVYSTYSDGTPISLTMDLTFQEVVPVYETDYDTIPDTQGVGY